MNDHAGGHQDSEPSRLSTDKALRLLLVAVLVYWCFLIVQPFLLLLVWGIILAVALGPLFERLNRLLGGRRKLAGTLFILVGVGLLVAPLLFLSESFLDGLRWLRVDEHQQAIHVPPPPASVAEWPIIGEQVQASWSAASANLQETLREHHAQVRSVVAWIVRKLAGFGVAILVSLLAVVVAGVILIHAEAGARTLHAIGIRVAGQRGAAAVDLAAQAIRSVATGVIGVAAVQSVLAAIGLFFAGVPAAALWAGLVLILAIVQLPPLLILGPAIIYLFATSDNTLVNVAFAIWGVLVSFSDAVLKPMFLGRGMDIPMPVILFGAIGGMIRAGVIGLFVGAVVLAIGYKIVDAWMKEPA